MLTKHIETNKSYDVVYVILRASVLWVNSVWVESVKTNQSAATVEC